MILKQNPILKYSTLVGLPVYLCGSRTAAVGSQQIVKGGGYSISYMAVVV